MKRLFEELGLDPLASPEAITERLRERIEIAAEAERGRLREAWEELTLHPRRRVTQSVACFVELDPPPRSPPAHAFETIGAPPFVQLDAVALPRLESMLDAGAGEARSSTHIDMDPWPRELIE